MHTVYELWTARSNNRGYELTGSYPLLDDAVAAAGGNPADTLFRRVESRYIPTGHDWFLNYFIDETELPDSPEERIQAAITLITGYAGIDGSHHKNWVLDQALRLLAGDTYDAVIAERCAGDDGPDTYSWDEGVAP